ncbi:MAG: 3D domain-containing protein [Blastocatellia bacterium]|nr:3D domain-containing protein [Blastocatellia bacterium]MCS7156148.1 3D domain-containing protein [Blastocatellia bacterium]MDW8169214.1 3D domain-containing protein [Acidobacteriota bacterium]MDW8256075.1 3D domain-containing protein [Acidobacteriota bacterium]
MSRSRACGTARGWMSTSLLLWLLLAMVSTHAYFSARALREEEATPNVSVTTPSEEDVLRQDIERLPALTFLATAYSLPGKTASGEPVRKGIVAADPKILPIGSIVHLSAGPYSGIYTVLDTGLSIRGRMLDIWMPTVQEARAFGVRRVKVRVLRWGEKTSASHR